MLECVFGSVMLLHNDDRAREASGYPPAFVSPARRPGGLAAWRLGGLAAWRLGGLAAGGLAAGGSAFYLRQAGNR